MAHFDNFHATEAKRDPSTFSAADDGAVGLLVTCGHLTSKPPRTPVPVDGFEEIHKEQNIA